MSNYITGALHFHQPKRDRWDVTYIPLKRRYNGGIEPRSLIPDPCSDSVKDWTIEIATPECYGPLTRGGVLDTLPFNVSPTLLKDLWINARPVYDRIIKAHEKSSERFDGHSNALMQASPNHAILPLAKKEDKLVHIEWAMQEYVQHYKTMPEGAWLPETAVCEETLALLADHGIKYVVLAPYQAKTFKKIGGDDNSWQDPGWLGANIDPSKVYKVHFTKAEHKGKNINVFFYDGDLSHNIAFPKDDTKYIYDSSENFLRRWLSGKGDPLKHLAVDGETFGHHHQGKADLLVGAVNLINTRNGDWQGAEFINYGLYLEKNPPEFEAQINEYTAWSCDVQLNRWGQQVRVDKQDNGHCWTEEQFSFYGANPNWHPYWRVQMRQAFDDLAIRLDLVYEKFAKEHLKDPRQAMIDYGSVVSTGRSFYEFFEINRTPKADMEKAYKLLEMQKFKQFMFTSCGWFHEYVGRIEPFTNFLCANSAIRIADEFSPDLKIENDFYTRLSPDMVFTYNQAKEANKKFQEELNNSTHHRALAA